MPGNAYFVPTPEAALTAVAARSLQGLGCGTCRQRLQNQGAPVLMSGLRRLHGIGDRLPPQLAFYLPGVPSPSQLQGLAGLGAGPADQFNRAVARGIYTVPFLHARAQGSRHLGQLDVDPTTLLVGIGVLALGMFLLGGKHVPRIRKYRAKRLRRKLRELEA